MLPLRCCCGGNRHWRHCNAVVANVERSLAPRPSAEAGRAVTAIAKTRPAWVDAPPRLVGDVYQMSIMVGPYTTRQECDAHLGEALQEALDRYVEICLGAAAGGADHAAGRLSPPATRQRAVGGGRAILGRPDDATPRAAAVRPQAEGPRAGGAPAGNRRRAAVVCGHRAGRRAGGVGGRFTAI